ncbi:MAG: hypothetical protein ABSH52_12715 [Terriglobia bacterium]|jgi:hypothetical protein
MAGQSCNLRLLITAGTTLAFLLGSANSARLRAGQNPAAAPSNSTPSNSNPPPSHVDPKAQQIFDRLIQVLGGPAFLKVRRLTTRGRTFSIRNEATSAYAPFESYVEYPDKRRFSYGKSKPVILINNGDQAWELDQMGMTTQLPEQVLRWKVSNRYSLENLLRLRIHEPGILIQTGGVDFVDNVATQSLDMVDAQGTQVKLDLNRQTLLPVSVTYRVHDPKTGDWNDFADVYSEYKNIDGVTTPMHIARFMDGDRVSEVFRSFAHYDDDYPATYFQPVR